MIYHYDLPVPEVEHNIPKLTDQIWTRAALIRALTPDTQITSPEHYQLNSCSSKSVQLRIRTCAILIFRQFCSDSFVDLLLNVDFAFILESDCIRPCSRTENKFNVYLKIDSDNGLGVPLRTNKTNKA